MDPKIAQLYSRLRAARRITVLTGAGVSQASGVPTFRGADGLWRSFRPEDLATPHAFRRDPRLVSEWYDWRRSVIAACQPNEAHTVLARWGSRPGFTLITQNVDGLHERAGSQDVVRFHGSIWHLRCAGSCRDGSEPWEDRRVPFADLPPRCPHCGGYARP
ncbi:MAG TPA: Sir2 family NAD-dependent protein deacetylase, partial [Vicinamibacterales bacterium]|nr:Sir2 family NAD-dependent protein deacetylase [Vicinamibacterales bacterium]